ncbi:hypothetical protein [Tengunoibacter tsumagoiensis]|uniref:hypothetical protein n=1 Tax=Tengunoibacter tsumagoiensis TaxID=2014871 RepID=UPI001FE87478|nr:hypothetical protein [Tengunoibacter tsumagoiensis]
MEGKVVSCTVEDKQGQRFQINKEVLTRLDSEKGPFEWTLVSSSSTPSAVRSEPASPHLRRVAPLELEKLDGWSYRHKMMLSLVFELIDGHRTIDDVKAAAPLPTNVIEEAIQILLAMNVINIS